jgi:hypothetical protein
MSSKSSETLRQFSVAFRYARVSLSRSSQPMMGLDYKPVSLPAPPGESPRYFLCGKEYCDSGGTLAPIGHDAASRAGSRACYRAAASHSSRVSKAGMLRECPRTMIAIVRIGQRGPLSHGATASRPWHHALNLTEDLAYVVCHARYKCSRRNRHKPGQKSILDEILALPVRPNPEILQLVPRFSLTF